MWMLSDKYFRIALLISVAAHSGLLCPFSTFRFNRPSPNRLKRMEIIYYEIKENPPPKQEIIQASLPISTRKTDAAKIESAALAKIEDRGQESEELIVKSKVEVKALEPEKPKATEKKEIAKVVEEKVATPEDIPRDKMPLFLDYFQAVRERIKRSAVYPPGARRNLIEGVAHLSFVLYNEGSLREVAVKKSSGNRLLDRSAVQSIEGASPFPPFPKGLRDPQLRLSVKISYELD